MHSQLGVEKQRLSGWRDHNKQIFVVAQRENQESVTSDLLYTMGTIATVGPVQRGPAGMRLLLWLYRCLGRWPFRVLLCPVVFWYLTTQRVARQSSEACD